MTDLRLTIRTDDVHMIYEFRPFIPLFLSAESLDRDSNHDPTIVARGLTLMVPWPLRGQPFNVGFE